MPGMPPYAFQIAATGVVVAHHDVVDPPVLDEPLDDLQGAVRRLMPAEPLVELHVCTRRGDLAVIAPVDHLVDVRQDDVARVAWSTRNLTCSGPREPILAVGDRWAPPGRTVPSPAASKTVLITLIRKAELSPPTLIDTGPVDWCGRSGRTRGDRRRRMPCSTSSMKSRADLRHSHAPAPVPVRCLAGLASVWMSGGRVEDVDAAASG